MRLGEINIICTDLEAAKAFYCGLLGIQPIEHEGPEALHCKLGEVRFLLLAVAKEGVADAPYCQHAAISFDLIVPDLVGLVAKLKASGATFAQQLDEAKTHAFVHDPDGNVVELLQG